MGDVIAFKRPKPKHKGKTLCKEGHHKWIIVQKKQFDVKSGKLVTLYECQRCRKRKVETH